jgi:hypothetical protein
VQWKAERFLWIDESLSPHVARALNLVGYNAFIFKDLEEFRDRETVPDEEIIPWCGDHDTIWVHADDKAKVEHRKLIEVHQTKTIWVYRPGGKMSSKDQLRALSYSLPRALDSLKKYSHIEIRMLGQPPEHAYRVKPLFL